MTNKQEPILEITKEIILPEGEIADIHGSVYEKPIFQFGEQVHNLVQIVRRNDNKEIWALALYPNPMDKEEMEAKIEEIIANPASIQPKKK